MGKPNNDFEYVTVVSEYRWKLIAFGALAVIFIGAYIAHRYVEANGNASLSAICVELIYVYLKEIGFAILVGLVLVFTIDGYLKKREEASRRRERSEHDSENRDQMEMLLRSIYGRYIPSEVFDEVERCLLRKSFFRWDYQIAYRLGPKIEGHTDWIGVCATISFKLKNISKNVEEYNTRFFIERPTDHAVDKFCKFEKIDISGNKIAVHLDSSKEEDVDKIKSRITSDRTHKEFTYPVKLDPDQTIDVKMQFRMVKRPTDNEIWVCTVPSKGLSISVQSEPGLYEFFAEANHSFELRPNQLPDAPGSRSWYLDHGIFPHQSVVFWWVEN